MKAEKFIELAHSSFNITTNPAEEILLKYVVKDYADKNEILKFNENESHIIRANLLRWIFIDPRARSFVDPYGLRIEGAEIEGDFNLDSITIPFPLILKGCCFKGNIILTDAKTCFLSLEGSTCNSITARGIKVKGSIRLDGLEAKKGVDIRGANISGDFDCSGGRFTNARHKAFWAKHIHVGGNLSLIGSYVNGEANLSGAKIGGNLDCGHGVFINWTTETQNEVYALDTSLAEVGGKACFNSFKVIGHVFALEMKIGGDFDCTGGGIDHKTGNCHAISIDRSSIGGSVLLCQGFSAVGQVRLIGAKIAGDLDCSGGTFQFFGTDRNALYAPRAKVDSSVFLCECMRKPENNRRDFVTNGLINLELTNINHSIYIGKNGGRKTSIFNDGGIVLNGAKIINSLEWKGVKLLTKTTQLHLPYATVAHLVTEWGEKSWPNLWLDGLVYDAMTHKETEETEETEGSSKSNLSAFAKVKKAIRSFLPQRSKKYRIYLNWLKRQNEFNPQIYEQLATVLRRSGQDADATEISISKERERHKSGGRYWWLNPFKWLWWSVGYGYRAYRALVGAVFVVLLGWFIFDQGYDHKIMVPTDETVYKYYVNNNKVPPSYPEFEPLAYSFDAFLPIGKLQQQEKWHPDDHKPLSLFGKELSLIPLCHYLYFHALMGWVLTTLGIAGFASLIRKNY